MGVWELLSKVRKCKDLLIGFVLGTLVLSPFVYSSDLLGPNPYYKVQPVKIVRTLEGDILVEANFIKNGRCKFERLEVIGHSLGLWEKVGWKYPLAAEPNRLGGNQSFSLILITGSGFHSLYQIKTRHNCQGDFVDKTFLEFTSKDVGPYGGPK